MKAASAYALLLASPALAIVSFPISRRTDVAAGLVLRRDLFGRATVTETLNNNGTLYQASVTVGTPPQQFSLQLDTGSSDVYVLDMNCDQCVSAAVQAKNHGGCYGGTYNSGASTTYNEVAANGFQVSYGDGTGATGNFITESFGIGGVTINNLTMGVATKATTGNGLIGVGYDTNEAIVQLALSQGDTVQPYPSIVDTMLAEGLINTKAYSLYLDDQTASTGSIIFGGADTNKFIGTMKTVPTIKDSEEGVYREFLVSLTSISLTNQTGQSTQLTASSFSQPFLLDSGTTYCQFPSSIYAAFASVFQAQETSGVLIVDCGFRSAETKGYVAFTFGSGGPTINVPIDELVMSIPGQTQYCQLGMRETTGTFILGDTFLRSAYVVYDLANNQIGLAQTNFESTTSNLVEFKANETSIPTLTGQSTGTTLEPGVTSKGAAGGMPQPLDRGALALMSLSALFAVLGGAWFLM